MIRSLLAAAVLAVATATASAHMVYVVPSADGTTVTVVFSDTLAPDEKVKMVKVAGLELYGCSADGKPSAIDCKKEDHKFTANLAPGTDLAFGSVTYGLLSKSEKPTLLVYHPKAVLTGTTSDKATLGDKAVLEVIPVTAEGKTRFRLLAKGKPVADSEGGVLLPDGKKEKLKTDKDGYTPAFEGSGRFAVWLRHAEAKVGEHDGKKYEEARHYATLVVDVAK